MKTMIIIISSALIGWAVLASAMPISVTTPGSNVRYEFDGELYIDTTKPVKISVEAQESVTLNRDSYMHIRRIMDLAYGVTKNIPILPSTGNITTIEITLPLGAFPPHQQ